MPDVPLTREQIVALVTEVAHELPADGHRPVIVVVGGSLLAWHALRASTVDVDTVARIGVELAAAVQRIAVRHGLAPKWLNDSSAAFRP